MLRLATFKYIFVGGFFLPFKVYCKSNIIIRKSASVNLLSRITFGNPSKKSASISTIAANLYLGYNSITKFGKSISVGPGVNIIVKDNGALSIGDGTYFTSDLHIEVIKSVEIGNNCALSWGTTIIDDDHHEVQCEDNLPVKRIPGIVIGNHVWIGCNCTILRGTVIGNNCVVGAGSVVKGIFPDSVLIAGNPARVIRRGINWQ